MIRLIGAPLAALVILAPVDAVERTAHCDATVAPLQAVPPDLPPRMHNQFTGEITVEFTVNADGTTREPSVVAASWQPVGRSSGSPKDYGAAVLDAVSRWTYPIQHAPCLHRTTLRIGWSDATPEG